MVGTGHRDLPTVQLVGGFEAQVDEIVCGTVTADWCETKGEQEQHENKYVC